MQLKEYLVNNADQALKKFGPGAPQLLFYIRELGALNGTDVSSWDVDEIFTNDEGQLLSRRNFINQRFFKKVALWQPEKVLEKEIVERLARCVSRRHSLEREQAVQNYENRRNDLENQATRYRNSVEHYLQALTRYNHLVQRDATPGALAAWAVTNLESTKAELKNPFWHLLTEQDLKDLHETNLGRFFEHNSEKLYMRTQEIVLSSPMDGRPGWFQRVSIGKFFCMIHLATREIRFLPDPTDDGWEIEQDVWEGVDWSGGDGTYWPDHPFMHTELGWKSLCNGNAEGRYVTANTGGDLGTMLRICRETLTYYDLNTRPFKHLREVVSAYRDAGLEGRISEYEAQPKDTSIDL